MKLEPIDAKKASLDKQYDNIAWDPASGIAPEALNEKRLALEASMAGMSRQLIKAKTFALLLAEGRLAADAGDIFAEKLDARGIMSRQRGAWQNEYSTGAGKDYTALIRLGSEAHAYTANADFGHITPNSRLLLQVGFAGLRQRVRAAGDARSALTDEQRDFYEACDITLTACMDFCRRLSAFMEAHNADTAQALAHLAEGAPTNFYEALQLLIVYFYLHEFVAGGRVRTLGRMDDILYPFYKNDLDSGAFTKEELKLILKYFLNKIWAMRVPFDQPMELGGLAADGSEVTNELSYLFVDAYDELDIYSPKIHIRVSDKTPPEFVRRILRCIRGGNSSFVLANDNVIMKGLRRVGASEEDARDYVLIGCYEPAVFAKELPCTGNGSVNSAKAVEYVFTRGIDRNTGKRVGLDTGVPETYDEFVDAVKKQIAWMLDVCKNAVRHVERHYVEIYPDALLSCQMDHCVETGTDAYAGGALYNNSSLYFHYIATLTDAVAAVKRLVFEEKRVSFTELGEILAANWEGHEKLRAEASALPEKYGNGNAAAEEIMVDFSRFAANLITNQPNGRGGVFKASNFCIDNYVKDGVVTGATPDGRRAGDPLSKNLCASTGKDKNGITALIGSVTKIDFSDYPNGSVLDIILHPTAVSGEDGLDAMYALIMTFFKAGGPAVHGNVFDAEQLRRAQAEPEKYATMQVRVCGWNAYFVNLSKTEQDDFIKKTEALT